MAGPSSVEDYLSQVPEEARAVLEKLRKTIKAAAPNTTETISYQMPTFKYQGRALVGYAAFKNHCSLFPYSTKVMDSLKEELQSFDTSGKGATIRFPVGKPLPAALVRKLVKVRIEEIESRNP
ncbi:MAG: iron chaperone [Actinomycetota bacterium]